MAEDKTYLNIGDADHPVNVWWSPKEPDRIHLTTGDPQFTDENGARAGLRVVFSSNPRSADYNPGNFNRCAKALHKQGIAAPDLVDVHPRHLKQRADVIAAIAATEAQAAADASVGALADTPQDTLTTSSGATVTDPAEFGWEACPACHTVVVDLDAHLAAVHPK